MKILDLFSGIGGFSLGLERAGMTTVAFCEIDPFCRRVLAKHWPEVPIHDDITKLDGRAYRGASDVITAGFPCQDISVAGKRAGISGESSGLWAHVARLVREVGPRFVLLENSASLTVRGLGEVLGDLAELGYDAEWNCIPAAAVGAHHLRARQWILAYPAGFRDGLAADKVCSGRLLTELCARRIPEPGVGRVVERLPSQMDRARLRALGNAVDPRIPEQIGRAMMEAV